MKRSCVWTCALVLAASAFAQTSAPSTASAPADPTTPVPRTDKDGKVRSGFMTLHERYVKRAREGNVDLLFLGDSITQGWKENEVWQKHYAKHRPANFGISGDRTQQILWRIQNGELEVIRPKVVVLLIGTNNVTDSNSSETISQAISDIVRITREKLGAKVLLLGILPRADDAAAVAIHREKIAAINRTIAKLDDGKHVRYLDMTDRFQQQDGTIAKEVMPDYLHLSPKGYEIWADAMSALLTEMMQ